MTTVPVGCVRLYYPVETFSAAEREALATMLSMIAVDIKKRTLEPDTWFIPIRIEVADGGVSAIPVDDRAGTAE